MENQSGSFKLYSNTRWNFGYVWTAVTGDLINICTSASKARVFELLLVKTTLRSLLYKPRCLIPTGCSIWIYYKRPGSHFNIKASVFWKHTVMRFCDDARPVRQQQKTCSQLIVNRLKIDALVADMVAWYPALEDGARFVGCSSSQLLLLLRCWRSDNYFHRD